MNDLQEMAARLDLAALGTHTVAPLGPLTLDEAYEIQAWSMARRYARGERRIGIKMGLTSREKMVEMGVNDMIWGRLTDRMLVGSGADVSLRKFMRPRVEPEIAFLLKSRLSGTVDPATAMAAIAGVAPALEIVDSRYNGVTYSATDVVADNSSAAALVIGAWMDPREDFSNLSMLLECNGVARQLGTSAAVLGNPIYSLVEAARLVAARGETLQPGDLVMSGAATAAETLTAGQFVELQVERLGSVCFSTHG